MKGQKLLAAGATISIAEPLLAFAHTGGVGAIVGLVLGAIVYQALSDVEQATGREVLTEIKAPRMKTPTGQLSPIYRLFNGKSTRLASKASESEIVGQEESTAPPGEQEARDALPRPHLAGETFLFSEVLEKFHPTAAHIFLARTADGRDLTCSAQELCHVALAGSTGGGKSSIQRMLMLQLCKTRMQVLLLNPHYTKYDLSNDEDWTPFEPYLVHPPMECRDMPVIEHFLRVAAKDLIPKRMDQRAHSQPLGRPYFIVMDELPSIVREIKAAPEYMRVILEEGRKVGVFLISAAQDFLVKTISPNSGGGSIRECYRTAYYVGGDATTARVLLDMPANLIPEDELGTGVVMLRGVPSKKATQVYVPYVDNAALYSLLGPSTYKPETKRLATPELDLPSPSSEKEDEVRPSRQLILETIERLAETIDEKTLQELIDQLPTVREDEPDELNTDVRPTGVARQSKREQYSDEIAAWHDLERRRSANVRNFAKAMDMGETKAWELLRHLKSQGLIRWETRSRKNSRA